jgi:type I restriction enzyme S subunit
VKLGELLTLRRDVESVRPDGDYQFVGVYSFGRGLFTSVRRAGSEFKYNTVIRLREHDLVYPKLMAWEGAIGVVRKEHAGGVVSPEFPVFSVDATRVQPEFLDLVVRGPAFQRQIASTKSAGTNLRRKRLYPDALLRMEVPLPAVEDQAVAVGLALASNRIKSLASQQLADLDQLIPRIVDQAVGADLPRMPLRTLIRQVRREVEAVPGKDFREIGIRSHGKGIFHKDPVDGTQLESKEIYSIEPGDFVLNIVFAWEGALAVATEQESGMVGSHRFPTFRAIDDAIDLNFLVLALQTRDGLAMLLKVSPGGAGRNRTLSKTAFLDQCIPVPPLADQKKCVALVSMLRAQQAVTKSQSESIEALSRSFVARFYDS